MRDTFGERLHFSPRPVRSVRSVPLRRQRSVDLKPLGLWYGNREWPEFVKRATALKLTRNGTFRATPSPLKLGQYAYRVTVDHAKILRLAKATLPAFLKKYGVIETDQFGDRMGMIDWRKVARDFSGVEVVSPRALYLSLGRTDEEREARGLWLAGWDVTSGVVWDASAIRLEPRAPLT